MVSSPHQSPEFDDVLESIPCLPDPMLVQLLPELVLESTAIASQTESLLQSLSSQPHSKLSF